MQTTNFNLDDVLRRREEVLRLKKLFEERSTEERQINLTKNVNAWLDGYVEVIKRKLNKLAERGKPLRIDTYLTDALGDVSPTYRISIGSSKEFTQWLYESGDAFFKVAIDPRISFEFRLTDHRIVIRVNA